MEESKKKGDYILNLVHVEKMLESKGSSAQSVSYKEKVAYINKL